MVAKLVIVSLLPGPKLQFVFPHTEEHLRRYGGARGLLEDFKKGKFSEYLHSQVRGRQGDTSFVILLAEAGEIHGEIEVVGFHEPGSVDRRRFPYARRVYELSSNGTRLYPKGVLTYEDLYSLPSFQGTDFPHSRIRFAPSLPDDEYATLRRRIP